MSETLLVDSCERLQTEFIDVAEFAGKITVLDALSEITDGISINASHRSTQMGNGVDAEDD